jgi:glycosyltransferase involved in cell wall biosynthesis
VPIDAAVRVLILLPADIASRKIGGIQSFVRDFIKFAPDDFGIEIVGVTSDPHERPVGEWRDVLVEGRSVRQLSVARVGEGHRRARLPVALRYTLALAWRRRQLRRNGRILQFHRAGVPLAFIDRIRPAIQVVHLNVADIYAEAGESRWRLLPGFYHRVEDLTIDRMSKVFVVNEDGVRFYRERHPALAGRVRFMPTWFDDTIFGPASAESRTTERTQLLTSLGLTPVPEHLILFVGRLEKQKDPILLIESFVEALRQGLRARLLIVGDGDLRRPAEQHALASRRGDRIHFLGWKPRHEIARLMAASDLLLLTSRFEGMPITVLEALASGVPVVSTAVGEVPRLVSDGVSGWLASDRSPKEISAAMARALQDDNRALSEGARRAAAPYASSRVLGSFYDAHRELAASAVIRDGR